MSAALRFSSVTIALCLWATEAAATGPAVTVTPGANPPSTSTKVSGTGFGANEIVDLYFDTTDEELSVTDASGAFAAISIPVPAAALPGLHWITAGGRHSGLGAQAKFTVRTNWPQQGYGSQNKAFNPYENVLSPQNVAGLEQAWSITGALGPAIEDNGELLVATGTSKANVTALNPASGATIWNKTVSTINGGGLAEAAGLVLFGNGGSVEALRASNGTMSWTANTGQLIVGPVTPADGAVYAGGASGTLFVLDQATGATLWTGTADVNNTFGRPSVAKELGQDSVFAPCGQAVCALNRNGDLWSYPTLNGQVTQTAVSNGRVFFGDAHGDFVSVPANALSFSLMSNQGAFTAAPAVADNLVYAGSQTNLYAYDARTLTNAWSVAPIGSFTSQPAVANGVVYTGNSGGDLFAFNAANGALLWTAAGAGAAITANIVANGMLFATDANGNLYAYALNAGNDAAYRWNPRPPAMASLHPDLSLSPYRHATFRRADEQ